MEIQHFRDIISENPIKDIWKQLRFFLDVEFTSKYHCYFANISEEEYKKCKSNINKQAKQIGYCIRQAEEYFKAASQVGLTTRPNLLYYGAVSLSRALILLKRNGNYSFDALLQTDRHNHHGLEINRLFKSKKSVSGVEDFFSLLQCKCYTKPDDKDNEILWGNFPLFYHSLVPSAFHIPESVYTSDSFMSFRKDYALACADMLPIDISTNNYFNGFNILKTLPDMFFNLEAFGIQPDLCKVFFKVSQVGSFQKNEQGQEDFYTEKKQYQFMINRIPPESRKYLSEFYKRKNKSLNIDIGEAFGNISFEIEIKDENQPIYFPDLVDDIKGNLFYILKPEEYLPELAAHFILLFCLGMLSRYYPHVWVKIIDENVQVAEITDSLLNTISRKFPNLILDQMTLVKHHVHL